MVSLRPDLQQESRWMRAQYDVRQSIAVYGPRVPDATPLALPDRAARCYTLLSGTIAE